MKLIGLLQVICLGLRYYDKIDWLRIDNMVKMMI